MDYNLLKTFSKVAELGSFTQAAKALNQPKSRVSRAISRLESLLGTQLLRRTTRKTSLTDAGKGFHQKIYPLLSSIDREIDRVSSGQNEMSGRIRITASEDMGQTFVAQIVAEFLAKYPLVEIDTVITNNILDLVQENIDLAFRGGKLENSTLKQRKVAKVEFICVCSKEYAESFGLPRCIEDLSNHKIISFRGEEVDFGKQLNLTPQISTDSYSVLLRLVTRGSGVGILPNFVCDELIESKKIIRVLPKWSPKKGDVSIVYPPADQLSQRVRAFIDFSCERLK